MESTLSALLASSENGGPRATEALFSALYSELHRLAGRQLARNAPGAMLGATDVLHEAHLDYGVCCDIGAYEAGILFLDGFELGDLAAWAP